MAQAFNGNGFVGSWKPEAVYRDNDRLLALGVGKAATILEREMRLSVGRPGPTKGHKTGESIGGETIRPSKPGEPPRKREGDLRRSMGQEVINEIGTKRKVGSSSPIAFYLEFGTKRGLEPRPWARPALNKKAEEMNEAIVRTMATGDRSPGEPRSPK